jgi:hypothetical protein
MLNSGHEPEFDSPPVLLRKKEKGKRKKGEGKREKISSAME